MDAIKAATALILLPLLLCIGCGGSGGGGGGSTKIADNDDLSSGGSDTTDTSDRIFNPGRLLQIAITMDPADYDTLRHEGRSWPQIYSGCWGDFPDYSHFRATVSVDGEVLRNVDIRKKGFLGSLSPTRPSLKLDFDDHVPGQRLESLERLTLNNDRQDITHTHQCITYGMFRDAGLPAPRCNFARVSVNGQDLGIYTNVESIKKHFLRRNFEDDSGNLYEGQVADFGEFTHENFQLKTNEALNDRSDLGAVVEALAADDSNMPGLLGQVIDLDQFITHWAMEVITGHWDGAAGNANNYFVYHDPTSNLFHYIPWGTDGSMALDHRSRPGTGPIFRYTRIPTRLYQIPDYRDQLHARIAELMDDLWSEAALDREVDRIRNLTGTAEADMAQVRSFIAEHEAQVRSAIAGEIVQVEATKPDSPTVCNNSQITTISGSFTEGAGSFEYVDLTGNLVNISAAALDPEEWDRDTNRVVLYRNLGQSEIVVVIEIEKTSFGADTVPLHGVANSLALYERHQGTTNWVPLGHGGVGDIIFDATPELGKTPSLHFSVEFWLTIPGVRF